MQIIESLIYVELNILNCHIYFWVSATKSLWQPILKVSMEPCVIKKMSVGAGTVPLSHTHTLTHTLIRSCSRHCPDVTDTRILNTCTIAPCVWRETTPRAKSLWPRLDTQTRSPPRRHALTLDPHTPSLCPTSAQSGLASSTLSPSSALIRLFSTGLMGSGAPSLQRLQFVLYSHGMLSSC